MSNETDYCLRYRLASLISKKLPAWIPWVAPEITEILNYPEVKEAIDNWYKYNAANN